VASSIAGAALVVLVLAPTSASGGQVASSRQSAASKITLSVSVVGKGTGWVTGSPSSPGGPPTISCGTICSAQFPDNSQATLSAQAAVGSTFGGWLTTSGSGCGQPVGPEFPPGQSACDIFLSDFTGNASVQATFNLQSPPCTAPGVKGRSLVKAKAEIRLSHCDLGKVTHAFSSRVKKGYVISQNPKAHWRRLNGSINLVVSRGRR
jgi:hypothetical protein